MGVFDEIAERQKQTQLDAAMSRTIGVNSNQVGKFMNQATMIMKRNTEKQKAQQRATRREVIDTSEKDKLVGECGDLIDDVKNRISNHEAIYKHEEKMNSLYKIRNEENDTLSDRMGSIVGTVYTNNRRVDYQTPEFALIGNIRFLLILVFYICIALYIRRSKFISRGRYRKYVPMGILLSLLILPIFIDIFVVWGYSIFNNVSFFLDNSAPKNVYTDI